MPENIGYRLSHDKQMKERYGKKWLIVHWTPTGNVPKEYDDDDDDDDNYYYYCLYHNPFVY